MPTKKPPGRREDRAAAEAGGGVDDDLAMIAAHRPISPPPESVAFSPSAGGPGKCGGDWFGVLRSGSRRRRDDGDEISNDSLQLEVDFAGQTPNGLHL